MWWILNPLNWCYLSYTVFLMSSIKFQFYLYNQSCVVSAPGDNFQFFLIGFQNQFWLCKRHIFIYFQHFFFNQVHKICALFYGWISRQWPLKLQARTALGGQPEILQEFCHHTASTAGVFILLPFDQTWQHISNEIKKMPISFTLFQLYPSFQFFAVFYVR